MPGMGMPGMGVQMGPMAPMGGMAPMAPMGMQPSFQNFAMDGCGVGNLNSGMGRGWFKINKNLLRKMAEEDHQVDFRYFLWF